MRTHTLWTFVWLAAALASPATAQAPLAPLIACRSVALTTCRLGFCSTQLTDPGVGETFLTFDLAAGTYTMPGVRPEPAAMAGIQVEPGSPNHKFFETRFQIALAHERPANVDLVETENGHLRARATTTFSYPDGLEVITGYACERGG